VTRQPPAGAGARPSPLRTFARQERASFGYAFAGLGYCWRTQRHLRIHALIAAIAVGLGLALGLTPAEWAALVVMIAVVASLELLNTVVEVVVDLATPEFHPKAKIAKDAAAGAVLAGALGAVALAAVLFIPRLWRLLA
jgi:diacylglycerol kinase